MIDEQRSETRASAVAYLTEAGWSALGGEPPGGVAMRWRGDDVTLSLWYAPSREDARLAVAFRGQPAAVGVFRGGVGELRIQASGATLLGLLCWLTSSQRDLCSDSAGEWLDQVVTLCPETYAVVSAPGAPEGLARVLRSEDPRHVLH